MRNTAFLILLALVACNNPEYKRSDREPKYFGLQPYFEKEVLRLRKTNPVVTKTVVSNGKPETKRMRIRSWEKELSSFIDADINKRAWAGEFEKHVDDSTEIYFSHNEKVPVKMVKIFRSNKQISGIVITIRNHNYLYTSTDTLSYYPRKHYEVRKTQQIKLMNKKEYRITGIF